jgi:hypothetical protein
MVGRVMIPDYWVIGEIHSSFRDQVAGFTPEFREITTFQTDRRKISFEARMARKCHGREFPTILFS